MRLRSGEDVAGEITTSGFGVEVTLRQELGVGRFHRDKSNSEIAREHPLGGKSVVGVHDAIFDIFSNALVQVDVKRVFVSFVEVVCQHIWLYPSKNWS